MQVLKFTSGNRTYAIILNFDNDHKIKSFSLIDIKDSLKIKEHYIPMRDGTKLHTMSIFHDDDTQRGTVFLKTPYFEINQSSYFNRANNMFIKKGFNFVIQSNRGSFLSEGHFRWMDAVNIQDSYEIIDWISNQSFSNKKVMSFGISYDGYNALASSINAHESLKLVIACSAPANINTDSLTANQRINQHLLEFIAQREQLELTNPSEFMSTTTDISTIKDWDNILYKRNIEDWDDIIEASNNYDHILWKERSLLNGLANSNVETLHIAGLRRDQDARDTILAYQHIQEYGLYSNKHKLFLHSGGHGCGQLLSSTNITPYLSLITDNPIKDTKQANVTQYSSRTSGYITGDSYPLEDINKTTLTLESDQSNEDKKSNILGSFKNTKQVSSRPNSVKLSVTLKEDTYINGTPEILFKTYSNTPDARVAVTITFNSSSFSLNQSKQHEDIFGRTSVLISNEKENHITYPPKFIKLKAGTKNFVEFTQKEFNEMNPNTVNQDKFFENNEYGITNILEGAELILPTEI